MSPSALDESWGRISGAAAKAAGVQLIYGYLSNDPSKNLTTGNIRDYHQHGEGVWNGWESTTGRPLDGRAAGEADAAAAVAQIRAHISALGYGPANRQVIPHSLDRDLPASQFAACLPYYQGARHVYQSEAGWDVGAYGKLSFLDYLAAEGFTNGLFGTYAWQNGRAISPHIALFQYQNAQTLGGASVDFDRVLHAAQIGAWWPPGHPLNSAATPQAPTSITEGPRMADNPELFVVDKAECIRKRKTWWGWGLDFKDGNPRHIKTNAELQYRWHVQGMKPRKVSLAQFAAMGGK